MQFGTENENKTKNLDDMGECPDNEKELTPLGVHLSFSPMPCKKDLL